MLIHNELNVSFKIATKSGHIPQMAEQLFDNFKWMRTKVAFNVRDVISNDFQHMNSSCCTFSRRRCAHIDRSQTGQTFHQNWLESKRKQTNEVEKISQNVKFIVEKLPFLKFPQVIWPEPWLQADPPLISFYAPGCVM